MLHAPLRVEVDGERRRNDADVELAALADLVRCTHSPRRFGRVRQLYCEQHFVALPHGLPVTREERVERDAPRDDGAALAPREHDDRIEREEHGREIADRRRGDEVARDRHVEDLVTGPSWRRGIDVQTLRERWTLRPHLPWLPIHLGIPCLG